jgi:hypothetical protein
MAEEKTIAEADLNRLIAKKAAIIEEQRRTNPFFAVD